MHVRMLVAMSAAFSPVENTGPVGAGDRFLRLLKEVMPGYSYNAANSSAIAGWPVGPHGPYTLEGGWPIYSETSAYCVVMWLSGQAVAGPGTLVVEMGTLLGHSSRCLACGLELRKGSAESMYLAFDFFRSAPRAAKALFRASEAARASSWLPSLLLAKPHHPVLAAVQQVSSHDYSKSVWGTLMVDPVYHGPHRAVPGNIGAKAPATLATFASGVPVEVFSIDSAKSHSQFISQAASVWPRLRVGSVIHLLDVSAWPLLTTSVATHAPRSLPNPHPHPLLARPALHRRQFVKHQLHFFFAEFVLRGDVEVAYVSFYSSCWSFVVRKTPLDWARVHDFSFASRTAEEWAAIAAEIDALILRHVAAFRPPPAAAADLQLRIRQQHQKRISVAALKRAR